MEFQIEQFDRLRFDHHGAVAVLVTRGSICFTVCTSAERTTKERSIENVQ